MIVVNSLSALVAGNLLHSLLGSHRTTGSPLTAEARARGHRGRKFLDRGPWLPGSCCYWHWQERLIALARPVGCSRDPRLQCRDCTHFTVLWVICLIFRILQTSACWGYDLSKLLPLPLVTWQHFRFRTHPASSWLGNVVLRKHTKSFLHSRQWSNRKNGSR